MAGEKCILDPERECFGLMKARELELDLARLENRNAESHERAFKRLEELEKTAEISKVERKHLLDTLTERFDGITRELDRVCLRLESIEQKPAKRWEMVVEKIVLLLVAAAVGYFLSRMGVQT